MNKCPGQDRRKIRPEDVIEMKCSCCGEMIELWPPGYTAECFNCGNMVQKDSIPSCADWCPGGEEMVKECLGQERYKEWKKSKEGDIKRKEDKSMTDTCHHHNCIEELRADHERILAELDKLEADPEGYAKEFLEFTESFAEPHHQKEEKVLFPKLEEKGIPKEGGPIGVMLQEHEIKRGYVKNLKEAVNNRDATATKTAAANIIALLRDHIAKENDILYPMAQQALTEEELAQMGHQCEKIKEGK